MTDRSAKGTLTIAHHNPTVDLDNINCTFDLYEHLCDTLSKHVVNCSKSGVPCRIQIDDIELMVHPERTLVFWQPVVPQDDT